MKQCNICREIKDESEFNRRKDKKDGLQNKCRKCQKMQRENNKEQERQRKAEYRKNNGEWLRQQTEKWRQENLEWDRQQKREYRRNNIDWEKQRKEEYYSLPLDFSSFSQMRKEIELYEEIKESINGNVEVKCANCENWFEPTKRQFQNRLNAINGKTAYSGTENKLYCSDECKEMCPIYGQVKHPRGHKPDLDREVQPELAKMVLERDEYTCIKCQRHQNEIGAQCHHIEGINWNPMESADMDNCITLCKDCHKEVHKQEGCTYNDLKCYPHLEYK